MNGMAVVLLGVAWLLTRVTKLKMAVILLFWQSFLVTMACLVVGYETGESHMYIAALLTGLIKLGVIPYTLYRIVRRMKREREDHPALTANMASFLAALAIVLSYGVIDHALPGIVSRDALAASVALVLIGLLLIIVRFQAVLQIVGLITLENGLYLLGLSVTKGLPLIIEMGIFIDILIMAVILVFLTYRLKMSFATTDTGLLKKLKG